MTRTVRPMERGGGDRSGGIVDWETDARHHTTAARIIKLPTRRAVWLRLVAATRDPVTWELLHEHRAAWAEYIGRAAA